MNGLKSYIRQLFFAVSVTLITCVAVILLSIRKPLAEEITIAAASDLNFAIKDLITEYEKATGNHVKLSLGSSGNFFAQIQNGAPFDLYFSADIGYPKKLDEAGLIMPGSLYRYAVGRIVLWTNHASHRGCVKGAGAFTGSCDQKDRHRQSQACPLRTRRGGGNAAFQGL